MSSDATKDFNCKQLPNPGLCQELFQLMLVAQEWLRPLPSGGVSESVFMNPVHGLLHSHGDLPADAQLRACEMLPLEPSGSPKVTHLHCWPVIRGAE